MVEQPAPTPTQVEDGLTGLIYGGVKKCLPPPQTELISEIT